MSAEQIARAVRALREGRVRARGGGDLPIVFRHPMVPVIDASGLCLDLLGRFIAGVDGDGVVIFRDREMFACAKPPWAHCILGFAGGPTHPWGPGGPILVLVTDRSPVVESWAGLVEDDDPIILDALAKGRGYQTFAVSQMDGGWLELSPRRSTVLLDDDGAILGTNIYENGVKTPAAEMPEILPMHVFNFLACRNVAVVEPRRDRMTRKRLARIGVTVSELTVFPVGRSTRSPKGEPQGLGQPLTSVRGHFAEYGPEYGKGLLFGRLAGRFWIPQHARGSAEFGHTEQHFDLVPP